MIEVLQKNLALGISLDIEKSKGTGFLFCYEANFYIITARHVLYKNIDNNYKRYSNSLVAKCPDVQDVEDSCLMLNITLSDKNTFYHPQYDVAIVHLGTYTLLDNNTKLHPTYSDDVVKTQDPLNTSLVYGAKSFKTIRELNLGNDVYILGYPTTLGVKSYLDYFDTNKPVIRKGIISHVNLKKQHVIIDCAVFAGNSGGPVLQTNFNSVPQYSLIGLVSQYVPYRQDYYIPNENIKQTNYINSGYAVIVAMDNVIETISLFKKRNCR